MREKLLLFKNSAEQMTKAKQYLLFFGTSFIVLLGVFGFFGTKLFNNAAKPQSLPLKEKRIKIESSGTSLNQQEVWVDRLEKNSDLIKKRLEELEKLVKGLAGQRIISTKESFIPVNHDPVESQAISHSNNTPTGLNSSFLEKQNNLKNESAGTSLDSTRAHVDLASDAKKHKIQRISFQLDQNASKKIKRSIDHFVPAGSFARGVLTSGVIASTSIQASSSPQPVHIEITSLGTLPRCFKADIKQCFLIGSAYGDLAAERVFIRLEKLSCVERKTGEVIELNVDGYVTGEDGANGLRGIIVDRSGPAMRNAFIGGFFSGMGNFFGQQKAQMPTTLGQGGVALVNPLTAQHMLESGAGKGIGNAMEKFSDFYIKRAEQLQPVIEIEPGRKVDVVFKTGFDMNQTLYRQSLINSHDSLRRDVAAQVDESSIKSMKGIAQ